MAKVGAVASAACPACIGVRLLAERAPGLAALTGTNPAGAGPRDEPGELVS